VKRRRFLLGVVALHAVSLVRPEALPIKKAVFEEVGNSVLMTLAVPTLFRRGDKESLASIDSGFDTTLMFDLRVWQLGSRTLLAKDRITVKVRRDPWRKTYVVRERTSKGWARREFEERDAALAAATTLERVRLVSADRLGRNESGPYYFVEVLALRNPLNLSTTETGLDDGRVGSRDLEWFGQLVDVLAGERAEAEESIHIRTNAFYLLPR